MKIPSRRVKKKRNPKTLWTIEVEKPWPDDKKRSQASTETHGLMRIMEKRPSLQAGYHQLPNTFKLILNKGK
ncbi:hypothetical protein OS493_029991 [Desmophyllum pertusum]|uniref:Uncharacterized protein n=1 Tax=Desmophyllum pertusum TaxID=174260 RepID=A0A9X0A107_9CNID|nr:hypothetical protein OS493_029991 [Desmophyllum pertusum]